MSETNPADEPLWRAKLRNSKIATVSIVLLVTLVAISAFTLTNSASKESAQSVETQVPGVAEVGKPAPDFTATLIDGSTFKLSDYQGEPVWLVFQTTWCSGCKAELESVQKVSDSAQDSGLRVLAIYVGEDVDTVRGFVSRMGLSFGHAADENGKLSKAYGVSGVPAHFFIAADGTIAKSHVGVLDERQMSENLVRIR